MRAAFIAVVPDRVTVAVRPFGSAGNRQWLATSPRDRGAGALPVQAALAMVAADATIVGERAGRTAQARQDAPCPASASPFEARAPPAAA